MSRLNLGGLNAPARATAPGSPRQGDVYYDTALTALRYYDGGAWVSLGAAGGTYVDLSTDQTVGGVKTFTSAILGSNGSASAPAFSSSADPDTGMFFAADNTIRFTQGGTERVSILSNGQTAINSDAYPLLVQRFGGATAAYGAHIIARRSRSATIGAHGAVASGDSLGSLGWYGSDGANWVQATGIQNEVDGTPGTNDMPGRILFVTTADGASSPTERLRISSSGKVTVAAPTSDAPLRLTPLTGAPSTNVADGDLWVTSAGVYARVNGSTVGPLGVSSSGSAYPYFYNI